MEESLQLGGKVIFLATEREGGRVTVRPTEKVAQISVVGFITMFIVHTCMIRKVILA